MARRPNEARSALAGALGGEVVQDASRLAGRRRSPPRGAQSTPAPIEPALRQRVALAQREVAHVLRVEPGAAVAADQQGLRALGERRRRGAATSASGLPNAIS